VREEYLNRSVLAAHPVDLNANLAEVLIGASPIGDDEWLVRDYLLQLLKDEPAWEPWGVYLRESFIKRSLPNRKSVHGIGDPERWAALLTPSAFQQLKERVDYDFAPSNRQFHAPADEVALDLFVKNTPQADRKDLRDQRAQLFPHAKPAAEYGYQSRRVGGECGEDSQLLTAEPAATNPFRRSVRKFNFRS
jgi:hypothetical protein